MSTSKHIDQLCLAAAFLALLLTFALAAGERLGVQPPPGSWAMRPACSTLPPSTPWTSS